MKKIVSLLLALVMVLSLGVAAFAVDAEDANTTTTEEATPTVTIDQILEWIKGTIMPEINMDLMKEVIKQTKATIENIVELLKPFFDKNQNPNLPDASEIPAAMMNAFIDLLAKAFKTDRDAIINKLLEIPLVKKIMGWYGYKPATTTEAPATSAPETSAAPAETEVPNTGAAAAVAAVAESGTLPQLRSGDWPALPARRRRRQILPPARRFVGLPGPSQQPLSQLDRYHGSAHQKQKQFRP